MTRDEALRRVAGMLACESHRHIEAAAQISRLNENTGQALEKNLEIARALGIEEAYRARLALHGGDGGA